jgi:hypothetical protein
MKTGIVRSVLGLAVVLASTAFAVAQIPPGDQGLGMRLGIQQQNNSGEVGDVTLYRRGPNQTLVVLRIEGAPHYPQPAHIHRGRSCDSLDPVPAYPLKNVVNGRSSTIVNAPISKLLSGNYSVNVHQSTANLKRYVACGHLYT